MIGAIIGDIAGSRFEWHNIKTKEFDFFHRRCRFTDDSVMTLAVSQAILRWDGENGGLSRQAVSCMREIGRRYPDCGYGGNFSRWLFSQDPAPYNSYGNGAAMRVSACGFAAASLEQALSLSDQVTRVTHDHPEGMKGARATAAAIYLARTGESMREIRAHIRQNYYPLDFTLSSIREGYAFDVSCQGSVPQALQAVVESTGFEDAIRNAISIGGDSDTIAAIAGGVAQAYYGVPRALQDGAREYLTRDLVSLLDEFEAAFPAARG